MEHTLTDMPETVTPIPASEFNRHEINRIETDYPKIRQQSKGPTFALTYQGTHHTLMKDLGFSKEQAMAIEASYHELYQVSDAWVQDRLDEAAERGYVTTAFGLRLRTPLLSRSLRNHKSTPYEAQAESRTAGNALGQGYGLLTNRACNAFMEKVWASPYRLDILPVAMIHDAIYLVIRNNPDIVAWVNRELIQAMQWQELPELRHNKVKLGAELSLFYPSWADELKLPNEADIPTICALAKAHTEAK